MKNLSTLSFQQVTIITNRRLSTPRIKPVAKIDTRPGYITRSVFFTRIGLIQDTKEYLQKIILIKTQYFLPAGREEKS